MLRNFIPKQEGFFALFQKMTDNLVSATSEFHKMVMDLSDINDVQSHVDAIASAEQEADKVTHSTFELLHKTFITPFDRHDIHHLASGLDDILDLINRCAQRFPFYALKVVPNEMIELADLSNQASLLLSKAIYQLHSLANSEELLICCQNIDNIETMAHKLVLAGEKHLFLEENNFKHFFKLKDIYMQTKLVINRTQDVGNMLKGIVLEYS